MAEALLNDVYVVLCQFLICSLLNSSFHLTLRSYVTLSCVPSFVRALVRMFVHAFVRSCVRSFVRLFLCSFVRSFVRACVRSYVCASVCLFARSFFCRPDRCLVLFFPFRSIHQDILLSIRSHQNSKKLFPCISSTNSDDNNTHLGLYFSDKHFWTHGFVMVGSDKLDCVPLFLGELADDIFVCGKTINLLKLCCPKVSLF